MLGAPLTNIAQNILAVSSPQFNIPSVSIIQPLILTMPVNHTKINRISTTIATVIKSTNGDFHVPLAQHLASVTQSHCLCVYRYNA